MQWYDKYVNRITPEDIDVFINQHPRKEDIIATMLGFYHRGTDYKINKAIFPASEKTYILTWICKEIAEALNLPLSTLLHQILKPKCKDCKKARQFNCDIVDFWIIYNTGCHFEVYLDEDEASPPQGCDCWEPK